MTNSYQFYESKKLITVTKSRQWLPLWHLTVYVCCQVHNIIHTEYTELTSLNLIKEICHKKDRFNTMPIQSMSLLPDQETKTVTQKKKKLLSYFFSPIYCIPIDKPRQFSITQNNTFSSHSVSSFPVHLS